MRRGAVLVLLAAWSAAAAPVRLPAVARATLDDGLTVLIVPTKRLPLVDLRLVVPAGSADDPRGKEGLASLVASVMTQGAGKRTAVQIADDIGFVGGTLDGSAGTEQIVIGSEVLARDLPLAVELVHDVAVHPTFPEAEVARRREEALGALAGTRDDPRATADRELAPYILGDHPLGHPARGWESTVKAIGRDDLVAFHREHVRPDGAVLAVVGDVDPKALLALLQRTFADWKRPGTQKPAPAAPPAPAPPAARRVVVVSKPEVTQTTIRLACVGVARNDPDFFPLQVSNVILGGGFTSRMVEATRVSQGLTYGIASYFQMGRRTGMFVVSTFTRNEMLRKTVDVVLHEIGRLVSDGPTPDELAKAKRYLTGQFPLGLQAPDDLAAQLTDIELYGLDRRFLESYEERVNAVTLEDCRRVLKARVDADHLALLVVSDPDIARAALEGLGTVEVREMR